MLTARVMMMPRRRPLYRQRVMMVARAPRRPPRPRPGADHHHPRHEHHRPRDPPGQTDGRRRGRGRRRPRGLAARPARTDRPTFCLMHGLRPTGLERHPLGPGASDSAPASAKVATAFPRARRRPPTRGAGVNARNAGTGSPVRSGGPISGPGLGCARGRRPAPDPARTSAGPSPAPACAPPGGAGAASG